MVNNAETPEEIAAAENILLNSEISNKDYDELRSALSFISIEYYRNR